MVPSDPSSGLAGFAEIVVLHVQDKRDLLSRYGAALASGGLFVQREVALPVGSLVMSSFVIPRARA